MPIRQRGSGFEISASYKGKRKRRSYKGTRSEAEVIHEQMIEDLTREVDGDPGEALTLKALIAYCEEYQWTHASTLRQKRSFARRIVETLGEGFLMKKWSRRSADKVAKSFRDAGLSPSTIRNGMVFLKGTLSVGRELGCPIAEVKIDIPAARYRDRVLTREEEALVLECWGENEYLTGAVQVFLDCGLRVNELLSLKWGDVDFAECELLIRDTKNGDNRVVGYTKRVELVLTSRMGANPMGPFHGRNGRRFGDLWRSWKQKLPEPLKSDKEFVPHCLRHTFATRLAKAGLSIPDLQVVLGHRTPQMTLRYAHACSDASKSAASLLER